MAYQKPPSNSYNQFHAAGDLGHDASHQVLENTSVSGIRTRQTCGFFAPIGFTPMGGMARIQHPQGKLERLLTEVFNVLPTPLENGFLVLVRSNTMAKAITQRTRARFTLSAYNFTRRFFGPVLAYRLTAWRAA